jgi:hypothetical protein
LKLDDGTFYIAGGHVFTGTYREFETAEEKNELRVSQKYTGEIRKLAFKRDAAGKLAVALIERRRNPRVSKRIPLSRRFPVVPCRECPYQDERFDHRRLCYGAELMASVRSA